MLNLSALHYQQSISSIVKMRFNILFISILPLAFAYPNRRSIREWVAPGPNDSRGPCPGLNTLANHGYL